MTKRRNREDFNCFGKRLQFCRETLKLKKKDVANSVGIPESSYFGREENIRTPFFEEFIALAAYFDKKWQVKYALGGQPRYEGIKLLEITAYWLMFGRDDRVISDKKKIDELKQDNRNIQTEYFKRENELRRQLELFLSKDEQKRLIDSIL